MKKMCFLLSLFGIMAMLFLSGCGEQDIDVLIDNMANHTSSGVEAVKDGVSDIGEDITYGYNTVMYGTIPRFWYRSCVILKKWVAFIVVGCILAGMVLYEVFKKNMEIRKFALVTMCVKIPVIVMVITFVYAIGFGICYPQITKMAEYSYLYKSDLPVLWNNWCKGFLIPANMAAGLSIIIGIALYELFRKSNPEIIKFAINTLCKKIPGVVVLAVDVYAILFYVFT